MLTEVFDHTVKIDGFVEFLKEQAVKTWTRKNTKGERGIIL